MLSNVSNKNQKENQSSSLNNVNNKRNTTYTSLVQENEAFKATICKLKLDRKESEKKLKIKNLKMAKEIEDQHAYVKQLEERISNLENEIQMRSQSHQGQSNDFPSSEHLADINNFKGNDANIPLHNIDEEMSLEEQNETKNSPYGHQVQAENRNTDKNADNHHFSDELVEEPTDCWLQRHLATLGVNQSNLKSGNGQIMESSIVNDFPQQQHTSTSFYHDNQKHDVNNGISSHSNTSTPHPRKEYNAYNYETNIHPHSNCREGDSYQGPTLPISPPASNIIESKQQNTRTEHRFEDGRRIIAFKNKTEKEIFPDGRTIVRYKNGDVKTTNPSEGTVVYYYSSAKVCNVEIISHAVSVKSINLPLTIFIDFRGMFFSSDNPYYSFRWFRDFSIPQ